MSDAPALILPEKSRSIGNDLRRQLGADKVKDDFPTITAYSVDASIYKVVPKAVVQAETEDDIAVTVAYARSSGVPITPRAAGTNLTGSAVGEGIILECGRMNRILELNVDERWARVQPGLNLTEFNKKLEPHGLMFGPDPSSRDMCKLGGMLSNNSAGPHTLRYGSVKDNVHAIRMHLDTGAWLMAEVLADGDPATDALLGNHPALAETMALVRKNADLIRSKKPTVSKNSTGYNLFGLVDGLEQGIVDLPKLFVGSEGTLGVISEATLTLVAKPKTTATALIHFRHLEEVGQAVFDLLPLTPMALEVMDANTLDLINRSTHGVPADAAATLLAEFDGTLDCSIAEILERVKGICRKYRLCQDPTIAVEKEHQEQLWKARNALYPTLYRYDAKKKPINYVDDVVVPADRIAELVQYLSTFFKGQDVNVAIFGHIGNGNAHIVPLLDVNDKHDFDAMVAGYHEIHQTVMTQFGGSICGEHGDGRVRAEFVPTFFGEELYALFKQVKSAFDPTSVLNPGVKISTTPFTEHIDYVRLSKPCATCGKCNSVCPVFDVFQTEDMSSRGWFEIVTAPGYEYLNSKRVVEACVNCKSCRTVCPAGVDVSDLIMQKRAEHPNKLAGAMFALQGQPWLFEPFIKLMGRTQGLWDRPLPRRLLEKALAPVLHRLASTAQLPADMVLPKLTSHLLRERYASLTEEQGHRGPVAYFHGCAANYFQDGVGDAVIAVLRRNGIEPVLPRQHCSGTPIETYGHVGRVKDYARFNVESLNRYDTIVTGCASCTLSLKDYPKWFQGEDRRKAEAVAGKVRHISEMLAGEGLKAAPTKPCRKTVTYHSSCHLRAAGVSKPPRDLLKRIPGVTFVEMRDADRCAGGAGTFIVKDYKTSQKIFERKRAAIRDSGAQVVATSCPACMIQLKNGLRGEVEVLHIAELLKEAYRD
ncbi:MAG TPA: FAD-binding and (Fe-S)-binding domain-containing protein [Nitrospirales bacterium]|jgi:FAD/FMN-containing dehydrogenase/Fe-S oxidoreductase|nr:FAD-binding and (Fe-S)-binding domain-containing protein [Nitrospirales bacterium]